MQGAQTNMDAIYGKASEYATARVRRAVGAIVITVPYPQRDIHMKGGVS